MHIKSKWNFRNKDFSVTYKINKDTNQVHVFTSPAYEGEVHTYKIYPDTISPVINACTPEEEVKANQLRNFLLSEVPDINSHYSFFASAR